MSIQGDLVVLESNNYLPLPWHMRGALGLETGTSVLLAVLDPVDDFRRLPDIIITPLEVDHLQQTYTVDIVLVEKVGAVATFLTRLNDSIEHKVQGRINISLGETNTNNNGAFHDVRLVIEPVSRLNLTEWIVHEICTELRENYPSDIVEISYNLTCGSRIPSYGYSETLSVRNGWVKDDGWLKYIKETFPDEVKNFEIDKVVVTCDPEQRIIRYIIPKTGVLEIRARHANKPTAMQAISSAIQRADYNILSQRLSRTPGSLSLSSKKSLLVTVVEPTSDTTNSQKLDEQLKLIDNKFQVNYPKIHYGTRAQETLFLIPKNLERTKLGQQVRIQRDVIRRDCRHQFIAENGTEPLGYIFLSRRFMRAPAGAPSEVALEQQETVAAIIKACASLGYAVIQAKEPEEAEWKEYDDIVHDAVFGRLWASNACIALALDENGRGFISPSMGHEIGFFNARMLPTVIIVSQGRSGDADFGNILGKNRIVYADYPHWIKTTNPKRVDTLVSNWVRRLGAKL